MNNLLSNCGLVVARISASEKDLPVTGQEFFLQRTGSNKKLNFSGVNGGPVDEAEFDFLPPTKCRKEGGATFRTSCDDNGYPTKDK